MGAAEATAATRHVQVGTARVAYLDAGAGPALLLLHGCPFSSYIWRQVIARLRRRYRCIAPDLLGLGDTETPPGADWSLPAQAAMVVGLLEALCIDRISVVGHDHGAAVAQLLAADHPQRIGRLVLCNAEAYDNWPSAEELPFVRATQLPLLGAAVVWLWSRRPLYRLSLATGRAVHDRRLLTAELVEGYVRANLADRRRRAKTRRFLAGQLDPANQRSTRDAIAGLMRFDKPTMIVWGAEDPHFSPEWAKRLHRDIPGATRLVLLPDTGHLLMEERPEGLAALIDQFLTDPRKEGTNGPTDDTARSVVRLADAASADRGQVGGKAATLALLAQAGFPVPPGFVVTAAAFQQPRQLDGAVAAAAATLGAGPFAVRSSAAAEDLPDASYAGLYETFLNVDREDLPDAVRRCFASAAGDRVAAYHATGPASAAGDGRRPAMAVLVQPMVGADAAGVAFTANPLTGDRDQVVVTAVRGLGERLVSGQAVGDEWTMRGQKVTCRRATERAVDAAQVRAVAELARRVAVYLGCPQEMEWAIADGRLVVLQARPMTALPEPVDWIPPRSGWWLRNLRLGEWLPEPVTQLFADWLLPALERGVEAGWREETGIPLRPDSVIVNGWYYTTPPFRPANGSLPRQLLRHPRALLAFPTLILLLFRPDLAHRELNRRTRHWREQLLPRYRQVVTAGEAAATDASAAGLLRLVDQVGEVAGQYLLSVWTLAGSQWKIEATLARFCRRHLPGVDVAPQLLVSGLPGAEPDLAGHAAYSADWFWPTAGETAQPQPADARQRHDELVARRQQAEARCRAALADRPRLRRRFDRLLAIAQRYAVVREQQPRQLTLGWPLLRRCVLRLAEPLHQRRLIGQADDVFFLTRAELDAALHTAGAASLDDTVQRRRAAWQRQRRLVAPLELGRPPALAEKLFGRRLEAARPGSRSANGAVAGQPASPGRATGPVRVVFDPNGFAAFQPGEVLVARATTPAWTPLFATAAAVVTDGGTLAAHASLVAREYGIPAVVATGDATTRLRDGQLVTVDGNTGIVQPHTTGLAQRPDRPSPARPGPR